MEVEPPSAIVCYMRKIKFINNNYYHIFNRGVDKRKIFLDAEDLKRFFQTMEEFNTLEPIGSIYENHFRKDQLGGSTSSRKALQKKLVNFICYCLNPNHYHFILEQAIDNGIEKFMHRLGTGYTMFFNSKYDRSGSLFQGRYKAVYINSDEYFLHLIVYINLNDRAHGLGGSASKSSWEEYINNQNGFCKKDVVLRQFKNSAEYKKFAEDSLKYIKEQKEMKVFLLE